MTQESDSIYFTRRAAEERDRAAMAEGVAAAVHQALAGEYQRRAAALERGETQRSAA